MSEQTDAQFVAEMAQRRSMTGDCGLPWDGAVGKFQIAITHAERDRLVLLAAQPTCGTCRYFDRYSVAWCMKGVDVPVNVYIGVPSFGCTLHQPDAPAPEREP